MSIQAKICMLGIMAVLNVVLCSCAGKFYFPLNDSEVAIFPMDWREKIPARQKSDNKSGMHAQEIAVVHPVKFAWQATQEPYTLEISSDENCSLLRVVKTAATEVLVYNLFANYNYYCRVLDAQGKVVAAGTFRTADTPRWIKLPESIDKAPINFRDLGSWRTVDGRRVRQGMIYRGADLAAWYGVSEANKRYMTEELGIKSEIDMRYATQVADKVNSRLGNKVKLFFRPINAYNSFTPEQSALFRDTIRIFADKENYPIYFHCQGGVDRTGEIAYLINGLLGVEEEQLLEDYELSSLSRFPRHRNTGYFKKWRARIASYAPAGAPVQEQVEKYLLAIGVTADEINAIREIMLEK